MAKGRFRPALALVALTSCGRNAQSNDTVFVSNEVGGVTLVDGATGKVEGRLEPVTPWFADQQWPMQFVVSVGVRKDDQKLVKAIDRILICRRADIQRMLAAYRVPLLRE